LTSRAATLASLLGSLLVCGACTLVVADGRWLPHSYAEVVRFDAPSSYWRFGDRTRIARDETGRADAAYSPGVSLGAVGALAGDRDDAAAFDGKSGFAASPDVYTFLGTHPFTIEVWIAPAEGGLPTQRVCNHRYGSPHTGWLLFLDAAKNAVFERWSNEAVLGRVSAPLALGRFSYVVVVYDGTELSLWVDGARRDAVHDEHPIDGFAAPLVWGAASTMVIDFFSGRLDEGAVYDHALAPGRIAAHWIAGARAEW
jgi:hypothetical protein